MHTPPRRKSRGSIAKRFPRLSMVAPESLDHVRAENHSALLHRFPLLALPNILKRARKRRGR